MRKLLDGVRARLQAFLDQRDDVALVLRSPTDDTLPILKTFEALEATRPSELHWRVTDAFKDATSYAAAVVQGFTTLHGALQLALAKEGMTPWPPIPPAILADTTPPAERLRRLAAFSRELLPVPNGGNNVWVYYPLEVADPAGFAALMADVLQHDFPFPWCHHLRFIVREDPAAPALHARLGRAPRIEWYQPDLGMEAVSRSLAEEVADRTRPLEERLGNLLVLAGMDSALGRHDAALQKYEALLRHYAPAGNHPMAAVALNGMGECYQKQGDLEHAGEAFQAALIPASIGENPPYAVFLNVVMNLADLRLAQKRWAEGEGYYDAAQQLASVARNPASKLRALEFRGVCQQNQGKLAEAERTWLDGSGIAAQLEDVDGCRAHVGRLHQLYAATGRAREAQERREQLVALGPSRNGGGHG